MLTQSKIITREMFSGGKQTKIQKATDKMVIKAHENASALSGAAKAAYRAYMVQAAMEFLHGQKSINKEHKKDMKATDKASGSYASLDMMSKTTDELVKLLNALQDPSVPAPVRNEAIAFANIF